MDGHFPFENERGNNIVQMVYIGEHYVALMENGTINQRYMFGAIYEYNALSNVSDLYTGHKTFTAILYNGDVVSWVKSDHIDISPIR